MIFKNQCNGKQKQRELNITKSWFLERINNSDKTVTETALEKREKMEFIRNVRYGIIKIIVIEKIKMSCFEKNLLSKFDILNEWVNSMKNTIYWSVFKIKHITYIALFLTLK